MNVLHYPMNVMCCIIEWFNSSHILHENIYSKHKIKEDLNVSKKLMNLFTQNEL